MSGDLEQQLSQLSVQARGNGLSKRGERDLASLAGMLDLFRKVLGNPYDAKENPDGVVLLGVADNSLCRAELVEFFTSPGRLVLHPRDLTYADRFFASGRVLEAIAGLYNDVPDGLYDAKTWTPPLTAVKPEHILIGNGATEIIEACFWDLCDTGDGVLLSEPYYNAFDEDLTLRAGVQIVPVHMPLPEPASSNGSKYPPQASFAKDIVQFYETALQKAKKDGINVRALLVCNPHNPTGGIYPRETIVDLAKFAAKHDLHLVMDEIYARSLFPTKDVPQPTQFDSILRIDVQKEANLPASRVHVISSASKDFSVNGFRIGIFISQHNPDLITSMHANARFAQTASPAGQLFASLLNDRKYLDWFLKENRRRLTVAFDWLAAFLRHHQIPYVPSNAGSFCMIDLRRFLEEPDTTTATAAQPASNGSAPSVGRSARWSSSKAPTPERTLTHKFIANGVMIAPGTQYHFPIPGWFRITFSITPTTMRVGLSRMEKTLGLESWIEKQELLRY